MIFLVESTDGVDQDSVELKRFERVPTSPEHLAEALLVKLQMDGFIDAAPREIVDARYVGTPEHHINLLVFTLVEEGKLPYKVVTYQVLWD